ncbi:MAG: carbon-nitrogen hydrolase family protein, partial [Planctomycetota bacterium]
MARFATLSFVVFTKASYGYRKTWRLPLHCSPKAKDKYEALRLTRTDGYYMPIVRLALANVASPTEPDESVEVVLSAIKEAATQDTDWICFPECFVPGYRIGVVRDWPDRDWLQASWQRIDLLAKELGIGVILGTERHEQDRMLITVRVTNPDGTLAGFQDKVQLDPSEESTYQRGSGRRLFEWNGFKFGVVICHEGWRYPETVRWAARQGAQVVFHPHFDLIEDTSFKPRGFADPENTFHEKAALCRAAENTCYFATVNCALPGATTTSALVDPEGRLIEHQPYGVEGLLVT